MNQNRKSLGVRGTLGAVLAVCVMAVAGTSAAQAAGTWNEIPLGGSAPATLSGTLTISQPGSPSVSCPVVSGYGAPSYASNASVNSALFHGFNSRQTCANGGPLGMNLNASPQYSTYNGTWSLVFSGQGMTSQALPVGGGGYVQTAFSVPFTNGSGGTASKATFLNKQIGLGSAPVYATGTLNLTRNAGGTLTVQ